MLASVSKVAHMSELLNIKSSRGRHIDAMHGDITIERTILRALSAIRERITLQMYEGGDSKAVIPERFDDDPQPSE